MITNKIDLISFFIIIILYYIGVKILTYIVERVEVTKYDKERSLTNEEYIILKHNSRETNSHFFKYYIYNLYLNKYISSTERILGSFMSNKNVDFYSLSKCEKLIYNFFIGKEKRKRFAEGDPKVKFSIYALRGKIKENLIKEGLLKSRFNYSILSVYFFEILLVFLLISRGFYENSIKTGSITGFLCIIIILIAFVSIDIVSYNPNHITYSGRYYMKKFENESKDVYVDFYNEKLIYSNRKDNLKRYLITEIDFLKILGNK